MKLFLLIFSPLLAICQKNCQGIVVDKITGGRIPYATVGLTKVNNGVSADEQGSFTIGSFFPKEDSLRISSVGYETMLLPVATWVNGSRVALQPHVNALGEVVISTNRQNQSYAINSFRRCSSNWYQIGLETIYQLAQRFKAPNQGMQLIDLELCKDGAQSLFRLRIYDVDSATEGPGKDLVDTLVEVKSSTSRVQVDLKEYNIVIPGKSFFVAVEWIFVPFNEESQKIKIRGRKNSYILYRPFLRWVNDRKAAQGNVWVLNFNGKWSEISASSQDYNFQITAILRQ